MHCKYIRRLSRHLGYSNNPLTLIPLPRLNFLLHKMEAFFRLKSSNSAFSHQITLGKFKLRTKNVGFLRVI